MTTTISITRALAKVKHLDAQISNSVATLEIARVVKGEGQFRAFNSGSQKIEDFEAKVKEDFQSLNDMIAHRAKLKSAITLSNTSTKVTISGKEMTVAEAIEAKAQIGVQEAIINRLSQQYVAVNTLYNREKAGYDQKEEKALEAYGGRDKAPKEEDIAVILKPLREKQSPSVSDPLDSAKVIEARKKELEEFRVEVDFVLSESNASTKVEV